MTGVPDTGWNPAALRTCIRGWGAMTCSEWVDAGIELLKGSACVTGGRRPLGFSCFSFAQCVSTYCAFGQPGECGKCAPTALVGEACKDEVDCQRGAVCHAGKCTMPAVAGAACGPTIPCRLSLRCAPDASGKDVCSPLSNPGEACNSNSDCAGEAVCWVATKKCVPLTLSASGCGFDQTRGPPSTVAGLRTVSISVAWRVWRTGKPARRSRIRGTVLLAACGPPFVWAAYAVRPRLPQEVAAQPRYLQQCPQPRCRANHQQFLA